MNNYTAKLFTKEDMWQKRLTPYTILTELVYLSMVQMELV